jgi:hypothetical protein
MKAQKKIFAASDIRKIGKVLGVAGKSKGNNIRFEIDNPALRRKLAVEIYPNIVIGNERGNLISVSSLNAYLQLHFCSGYVVSEMLGEVTFVGEKDGRLSGLIVEREGGCTLYANVDRSLLSGDLTQLGPEVMMSGIALSLTESMLPDVPPSSSRTKRRKKK